MKDLIKVLTSAKNNKADNDFKRIMEVLQSSLNVGEVRFKSNVFAGQVHEEIMSISNEIKDCFETNK